MTKRYQPRIAPRRLRKPNYSRGQRFNQIVEYLFWCHQQQWRPSSYEVAVEMEMKPSHHVRRMLQELAKCGIITMTEGVLPNGRDVHYWSIDLEAIDKHHPEWKNHLTDKFNVWPVRLI